MTAIATRPRRAASRARPSCCPAARRDRRPPDRRGLRARRRRSGATPTRASRRSTSSSSPARAPPTRSARARCPTAPTTSLPHAEAADFDDSGWERARARRTRCAGSPSGRVCFNWYRIEVTIPERVGDLDPTGVDGRLRGRRRRLRRGLGERRAAARARRHRRPGRRPASTRRTASCSRATRGPGDRFVIAVFGINGPISASPRNYIWMRTATLEFYARARRRARARSSAWPAASSSPRARCGRPTARCSSARRTRTSIYRLDPELEQVTRVPLQERLHRRRHRPLPPARLQRAGLRARRAADDLPARQPARDPRQPARRHDRARRRATRAGGSTAPTTSSTAPTARCTSPTRRSGCPGVSTTRPRSSPFSGVFAVRDGEVALVDRRARRARTGSRFSPDERYALRRQLGPRAQGRHALRRCRRRRRPGRASCAT